MRGLGVWFRRTEGTVICMPGTLCAGCRGPYSYIIVDLPATARTVPPASGQHDLLVLGDDAAEVGELAAQVVAACQLLLGGRRQVGQHEDPLVDQDGDDVLDDADELQVRG